MQCRSSQECVFYTCLQVTAEYVNAIVRSEDAVYLNVMHDGDLYLSLSPCQGVG